MSEMSEDQLRDALRARYPASAWALFDELRNGTGWSRRTARSADAVVFSLWPSRGLDLHGFEIKVDRRDLVRELAAPQKADEIARYCDFWWLVLSTPKIAEGLSIPRTWGVLVPGTKNGKTLLVEQKAAAKMKAKKLDRLIIASILRNAQASTERKLAGYVRPDKVEERAKELADLDTSRLRQQLERQQVDHAEFVRQSQALATTLEKFGLGTFSSPQQHEAAAAVARAVRTEPRARVAAHLARNADDLQSLVNELRKAREWLMFEVSM